MTSPRTIKTTRLTRIHNNCSAITKGKTLVPVYSAKLSPLDGVDMWMGDHLDRIPCAVLIGKSSWRSTSIMPSTSTTNAVCGLSLNRSQPDFEGFLWALRFLPHRN